MTTEAPTTAAPTTNPYSAEERLARIEAQQEIIIELLKDHSAKFDIMNSRIDATNSRIDALNHRIFLAGLGLFTIVGAGVAAYIVNLLT